MQTWDCEYLAGDIYEMAAADWHGLSKNHAFVDGNKRVGFMAADAFLRDEWIADDVFGDRSRDYCLAGRD